MRVNEGGAARGRSEAAGRFGDALRRAEAGREQGERAGAAPGRASPAAPRPLAHTSSAGDLPGAPREEAPPATGAGSASLPAPPSLAPSPVPELAALVRALPAAVEASRTQGGASLALSFGRSLEVDLRTGAGGVEVVLRPDPRLARAAEAELPRIVAALRARGVAVGRAEVRARGGAPRGAR